MYKSSFIRWCSRRTGIFTGIASVICIADKDFRGKQNVIPDFYVFQSNNMSEIAKLAIISNF